ncbi:MAG: CARDB domain-containing protein, partial [Candidatus Poseidoniales archaeon]
MPGSSKELSTIFIPQIVGNMEFLWYVYSPMGGIDPSLNGSFNVEILEPQSLVLSYNSYEWELSSSLKIDFSLYLSNGASRPILLNIFNELEPEDMLYSSKLVMDNGFRLLSVNLGNPDFSNLAIEVIPLSWFNSIENSINTTSLNVIIPFADIDLSIDNYYPKNPSLGENLSFEYTIINNGNSATPTGIVRIIMPDQNIIYEGPLSSLSSGGSYTGTINIESWNYVQLVNTTMTWISDSNSGGDWVFITPSNSGQSDSY